MAQVEMFGGDAGHTSSESSRAPTRISGSIEVVPLGKGVRVTGRDADGRVLWGFVATRTMLEQPHGAIAIYDRLRDLVNERLDALGLPMDRPEDVLTAAESKLSELERFATQLRKTITITKGKKPTGGQLEKARDVYRAIHDMFLWISEETEMGRTAGDSSTDPDDDLESDR